MLLNKLQYAIARFRARTLGWKSKRYVSSYGTTLDGRKYYVKLETKGPMATCLDIDKIAVVIDPRIAKHVTSDHVDNDNPNAPLTF